MNRRNFFRISAAGALALPRLPSCLEAAQVPAKLRPESAVRLGHAPDLVLRALSTTSTFPVVEPVFAGVFKPGATPTQLIGANGFSAFSQQVQTLASAGYRVASFTTILNMNATWYYAALQPGSGTYMLAGTSDPNEFQQTFTANQSGYRLVDFSIVWQQGRLYYTGYWLAVSEPANQTLLWDVNLDGLNTQTVDISNQGKRMTRIQSFPQQELAAFSALFEPGTGAGQLFNDSLVQFPDDVTGKFSDLTLAGLGYDSVEGRMFGCSLGKVANAQFVWNLDWNTLSATAQQLASNGLVLSAVSAYPNAPDFDDYFAANLAPFVMGYAYAVGYNGQVVSNGYGLARGPNESQNANAAFTPDVRMNLTGVSDAITGMALELLLLKYPSITLDSPFWPLIASMVPNPDPSVKAVTLRNLATMMSGLVTPQNEGTLFGSLWPYLNTYLAQALVGTPGVTHSYNDENFTILQGVIEQATGQDYAAWVTANVLGPAGIDTSIFNATPDPSSTATLYYSGPADTRPGYYIPTIDFVAAGGWISTANELLKIPLALRNTSVLPAASIGEMLTGGIGWFQYAGNYGTYYYRGGNYSSETTSPQTLNTAIVRLAQGYDIALVANTQPPVDVLDICAAAFDSRGLLATDAPPAITAVVGAATYLPKAAPGAYCAIIGSGFTDQPATGWSGSITGSALPTTVAGIGVNVNGAPAYVEYVSAGQVNFLLPSKAATGIANVELITPIGVMSATLEIDAIAPGLFTYALQGVTYAASVFATGSGVVYVAATGALPGYNSRPAAAGDIIELYATGCGPTQPAAPDGVVLTTVYPAANLAAFQVTIAGSGATVLFAGLVSPGLWQINVQIPAGLVSGNQPLVVSVNNVACQPKVMLTVQG